MLAGHGWNRQEAEQLLRQLDEFKKSWSRSCAYARKHFPHNRNELGVAFDSPPAYAVRNSGGSDS